VKFFTITHKIYIEHSIFHHFYRKNLPLLTKYWHDHKQINRQNAVILSKVSIAETTSL